MTSEPSTQPDTSAQKPLVINRVTGGRFGRFSERRLDLAEGFCVVHGPNESGKSTLSELIAWLIAGSTSDPQHAQRYAGSSNDDKLDGSLTGTFDDRELTIERTFRVKQRRGGQLGAETIHLAGRSLTTEQWCSVTGVGSGDEFFQRYRITDHREVLSVSELLADLGLGTPSTRSTSAILKSLKDQAQTTVPASGSRLSSTSAHDHLARLEALSRQRDEATRAMADIKDKETRLDELTDKISKLDDLMIKEATIIDRLQGALKLLETKQQLDEIIAQQAGLTPPDPIWTNGLTDPGATRSAITRIESAEKNHREMASTLANHGASSGLSPSELEGLTIPSTADARVKTAEHALDPSALNKINHDLAEVSKTIEDAEAQQAHLASELKVSVTDLERLASPLLDEQDVNLKVAYWVNAAEAVETIESKLAAAKRTLSQVSGTDAPSKRVTDPSAGRERARPALVALAVAGVSLPSVLAFVHPLLSVGAAFVVAALGVVVYRRIANRPSADYTLANGAVSELGEAQRLLDLLPNQLQNATIDASKQALALNQLLSDVGYPPVEDSRQAATLNRQRSTVAKLVTTVRDGQRRRESLLTAQSDAESAADEARADLSALNRECGLPDRFAPLNQQLLGQLRILLSERESVHEHANRTADLRTQLSELLGSEQLAALDIGELDRAFNNAQTAADAQTEIAGKRSTLEQTLTNATASDPEVREILNDPDTNAEHLQERIRLHNSTREEHRSERDEAKQDQGSIQSEISRLQQRSDLPALNYLDVQIRADLFETLQQGAGQWLAHQLVTSLCDGFERDQQPDLVRRASEIVEAATGGLWTGLRVDENNERFEVMYRNGQRHQESSLSSGAQELLRIALQVAVADAHGAHHQIHLPLLCDDPTGDIDSDRSPHVFALLARCAEQRQVILFTHDERSVALAAEAGATVIDINQSEKLNP
jgi:uncharacterized protein YhaN